MHKATIRGIRERRARRINEHMATRLPHPLFISPQLSNMLGALTPDIHKRLRQLHHYPHRYWDRDHSIIIGAYTLWQAVVWVDPDFPRRGPVYSGGIKVADWERFPTSYEIEQALLLAAPAGEI